MIERLPMTGYVLAGGRSTRMGVDKATLRLGESTLAEIAVAKLRRFCADVAIAGSREDLEAVARVVPDLREESGPAGALEAGLEACGTDWALFVPVDAPLVPSMVLQCWAAEVLERHRAAGPVLGSYLRSNGQAQPAFCMLRREAAPAVRAHLDAGERRLMRLFASLAQHSQTAIFEADTASVPCAAAWGDPSVWFLNANTPEDWELLQRASNGQGI